MIPIVSHKTLRTEIALAFATKLPFILRGAPGVGKTAALESFAQEHGIGYIDTRALYLDPTDVKGFPDIDKKKRTFQWLPPADFPLVGNDDLPDEGVWVFEELPSAAPAVQGALFQVINERRIGPRPIKPGWLILATGNRLKDKAVVNKMPSPMVSRLRHLELEVNADEWAGYAARRGLLSELAAFFKFRPELLNSFDPAKWEQDTPYCCPRTAEFLSRTLSAWLARQGLPPDDLGAARPPLDLLTGWIGQGVGTELFAFLDLCASLPRWDDIVRAPEQVRIPHEQPGHLYAFSALVARKATAATAPVVFKLLERPDLPMENQFHIMHAITSGPPELVDPFLKAPGFSQWAARNMATWARVQAA